MAKTLEEIKKLKFIDLTRATMEEFVRENHPDDMLEFARNSFTFLTTEQILVNGQPVLTKPRLSKKTGKLTTPRPSTKRIAIKHGSPEYDERRKNGEMPKFNLTEARTWFYDKYLPEMKKKHEEEEMDSLFAEFADLL